jgi:hypothetical protein
MALSTPNLRSILVIALFGALAGGLSAKPKSSLSDSELEVAEAKLTLDQVLEQNQALREKLTVAEAENAKLSESLVVAQSAGELSRREAGDLQLRLEALGIQAADGKTSSLQERLVGVLNNLRLAETDRKNLTGALTGLTEAIMKYLKTSSTQDAAARLSLEGELRHANQVLGAAQPGAVQASAVPATLTDGMVISVKEELSLAVANIGSRQGVRVGMPFQVLRDGHIVGSVRVIDAREKISGAVIQNLSSEKDKIKVGDILRVDATQ